MNQGRASASVLVADDNAGIRLAVSMLLRSKGYRVRCASDGGEAVSMILDNPPDIVILDIDMPVSSGLEVARLLHTKPGTAAIRLIAMTGSADPGIYADCHRAGFEAVCPKPFTADSLLEVLAAGRNDPS